MNTYTAKRLRKLEPLGSKEDTATVVCDQCGQRFAIHHGGIHKAGVHNAGVHDAGVHDAGVHDEQLAEKQVAWLQDRLVWDHIQERKHHGSVELPNLS